MKIYVRMAHMYKINVHKTRIYSGWQTVPLTNKMEFLQYVQSKKRIKEEAVK